MLKKGWPMFSEMNQIVNTLGFMAQADSVPLLNSVLEA